MRQTYKVIMATALAACVAIPSASAAGNPEPRDLESEFNYYADKYVTNEAEVYQKEDIALDKKIETSMQYSRDEQRSLEKRTENLYKSYSDRTRAYLKTQKDWNAPIVKETLKGFKLEMDLKIAQERLKTKELTAKAEIDRKVAEKEKQENKDNHRKTVRLFDQMRYLVSKYF
ncbi:hypothetical protein [Metabacillus sp. SLBN-84]